MIESPSLPSHNLLFEFQWIPREFVDCQNPNHHCFYGIHKIFIDEIVYNQEFYSGYLWVWLGLLYKNRESTQ